MLKRQTTRKKWKKSMSILEKWKNIATIFLWVIAGECHGSDFLNMIYICRVLFLNVFRNVNKEFWSDGYIIFKIRLNWQIGRYAIFEYLILSSYHWLRKVKCIVDDWKLIQDLCQNKLKYKGWCNFKIYAITISILNFKKCWCF